MNFNTVNLLVLRLDPYPQFMIYYFQKSDSAFLAVQTSKAIEAAHFERLIWLFSGARVLDQKTLNGEYVGPRKEMITPWSTNAVEIAQNCGIDYIVRIEQLEKHTSSLEFDPMLQHRYLNPDQDIFDIDHEPDPVREIVNIQDYNEQEGLALSAEEIHFLEQVAEEIKRPLTDSEIFGFSQINSEHCRHKIFNGEFIIDGEKREMSLFQWIKKTAQSNPNFIVSAYKDNVAFVEGPRAEQFAPKRQDRPDFFERKDFDAVISLKAETHNFPTTVEPFNGAATGSGGEIRDRLAGGQGSTPLAGTAVYMTSYPRTDKGRAFEQHTEPRPWLYQSPKDILIKASNGASDFGNKFGQPLIAGSLVTFEQEEDGETVGFDKVIMLAGGIGFGKKKEAQKKPVSPGEKIVVMGGDNYRIGMGGGAVSSVNTGEFDNTIELNAVQRSNPEMQKRVANAIRAMTEADENPIISLHDHGAGGHLNCLSELVEETGGNIDTHKLPIGDQTLSEKEILSNESQERMGLVISAEDFTYLKDVAERERAPIYEVGDTAGNHVLEFKGKEAHPPFRLRLEHLFGSSPKTVLSDTSEKRKYQDIVIDKGAIREHLKAVLQLEAVASKDWLVNKVDRCVTGKVALQQTVGEIQLPLNNVAVTTLDYHNTKGIATSIGHAPVPALVDAGAGSQLSLTESLTNLVFAPLTHGLRGVSLSANWMWPAKNEGENARLYEAVQKLSEFAIDLGINIPTGKDSLSMTQRYPDGKTVKSPGTVIISAVAEVSDVRKVISPALVASRTDSQLVYVPFSTCDFALGGSAAGQVLGKLGTRVPSIHAERVTKAFAGVQQLINSGSVLAGHDVSSGGLVTTLLEMNFPNSQGGLQVDLGVFEADLAPILFSEQPGIVLQVSAGSDLSPLGDQGTDYFHVGHPIQQRRLEFVKNEENLQLEIDELRDTWMRSSYLLDQFQTQPELAKVRYDNYKKQPLHYRFPDKFTGQYGDYGFNPNRENNSGITAAIIREKGVNSDREMAYALWLAGFDVKDVHMTDLIAGREDLSEVQMIVFVGGFSNSDVLGSAKGWAGSFLYNPKAKKALDDFYARPGTLSLGVCNGCQLMMELEVVYPGMESHPKMHHNATGKFECAFVNVDIAENNTIMFGNLAGTRLGIWLAHGEGRFILDAPASEYSIPVKYSYPEFPGNANGSDHAVAALSSEDGRHVAIMPHLERSLFPWNWAHYEDKLAHDVSPWMIPFANAFAWLKTKSQGGTR